jgi:hypothetical protein
MRFQLLFALQIRLWYTGLWHHIVLCLHHQYRNCSSYKFLVWIYRQICFYFVHSSREVQAGRFETTVVVPGARFTRYETQQRPRAASYSRTANCSTSAPVAAAVGTTVGQGRTGARTQRAGQRYEYYDTEYPDRRYRSAILTLLFVLWSEVYHQINTSQSNVCSQYSLVIQIHSKISWERVL